jgi:hypothetical protein
MAQPKGLTDEVKENLRQVEGFIAQGMNKTAASVAAGLAPHWYHSTKSRLKLPGKKKLGRPKGSSKSNKPTIVNMAVPSHVPSDDVRVIMLKGDSQTVREIVQGIAGVFNG